MSDEEGSPLCDYSSEAEEASDLNQDECHYTLITHINDKYIVASVYNGSDDLISEADVTHPDVFEAIEEQPYFVYVTDVVNDSMRLIKRFRAECGTFTIQIYGTRAEYKCKMVKL